MALTTVHLADLGARNVGKVGTQLQGCDVGVMCRCAGGVV